MSQQALLSIGDERVIMAIIVGVIGVVLGIVGTWLRYVIVERRRLEKVHEHSIVQLITQRLDEHTSNLYIPIINASRIFEKELRSKLASNSADDSDYSFYTMIMFLRALGKLRSIYLGNIMSNFFLYHTGRKIEAQLRECIGISQSHFSIIMKGTWEEPFDEFEPRLREEPFKTAFINYEAWLNRNENNTVCTLADHLSLYRRFFVIEINHEYRPWYKENPLKLQQRDLALAKNLLEEFRNETKEITQDDANKFLKYVEKYRIDKGAKCSDYNSSIHVES